MPHDPSGPCVVCGVETTQRCSSCAEHGFDLFICGRKHQKLIYFAHKRVCGINSEPFRFPPLTVEEVEEAILKRRELASDTWCIEDGLRILSPMRVTAVPDSIRSLGQHTTTSGSVSSITSTMCAYVRTTLYTLQQNALESTPEGPTYIRSDDETMALSDAHSLTAVVAVQAAMATLAVQNGGICAEALPGSAGPLGRLLTPFYHLVLSHAALYQRMRRIHNWGLTEGGWVPLLRAQTRILERLEMMVIEVELLRADVAWRLRNGLHKLPRAIEVGTGSQ